MRRFVRRWVLLGVVMAVMAVPAVAGGVGGFASPLFGLAKAPSGAILVADAGAGITEITTSGVLGKTIPLPGVTDVSPLPKGEIWATTGAGGDPTTDSGQGVYFVSKDKPKLIANLFDFETRKNPDGHDPFDSNPFDVQAIDRRSALVVDAGGNDLLQVSSRGVVRVLAVFPDEVVSTDNIKALAGCPSPAPFCELPPEMPAEPTPTSVVIGTDGYYYVGELKGFPGPTGESNIWRVSPGASWAACGSSSDCTKVFDGGFTSIIDLAIGPDGKLYVAEMDELSWAAVEIFQDGVGGTVNACDLATLTCSEVATGIPMLTAITFDRDGNLLVTQNSLIPGLAEVVVAATP